MYVCMYIRMYSVYIEYECMYVQAALASHSQLVRPLPMRYTHVRGPTTAITILTNTSTVI